MTVFVITISQVTVVVEMGNTTPCTTRCHRLVDVKSRPDTTCAITTWASSADLNQLLAQTTSRGHLFVSTKR